MALSASQRLRAVITIAGVAVSVGLLLGAAAAMPAGSEQGPAFSDTSAALFAGFFVLNPPHLVLVALGLPGGSPGWAGALAATCIDVAWWWFVAGSAVRGIERRRARRHATRTPQHG